MTRTFEQTAPKIVAPRRFVLTEWRVLTLALLASDAIALLVGFATAYKIRFKTGVPFLETPDHALQFYSTLVFFSVPVWLIIFAGFGLYNKRYLLGGLQEYIRTANACTLGMMVIVTASFVEPTLLISRGWLLLSWASATIFVAGTRFLTRRVVYRLRRYGFFVTRALIVGANEEGRALADQLATAPTSGLKVMGFVEDRFPRETPVTAGLRVLGDLQSIQSLVERYRIGEVIVAPTALAREPLLEFFRNYSISDQFEIRMSSGLFEILTTGVRVQEIGAIPFISPERARITGLDALLKTTLDYVAALVGVILAVPLFVGIAVLVKLDSPGPVVHRRRVLGRGGRQFDALKFRTMLADADKMLAESPELLSRFQEGFKLEKDPRVTRVGDILRRTSLDELPQLFNVLKGQMSLVGPRMIAPEEATKYGTWQTNLLTVKPGITGPWQVNGRGNLPYEERVRLSMHYIRNYTIWLDLQILGQTIPAVLRRKGAY